VRVVVRVDVLHRALAAAQEDCRPDPADARLAAEAALGVDDCLAVAALAAGDRLVAAAQADVHARRQAAQAEVAMRATSTAAGSRRVADGYRQAAAVADGAAAAAAAADDSPSGHGRRTTGVRDSNGPSRSQSKT
jgi:hypothetical protein